jgi:putative transposase
LSDDESCSFDRQTNNEIKPEKAIGEVLRRSTRMINFRENWKGYLWQGRFASYPMNKSWLLRVAAYMEMKPAKAGVVKHVRIGALPWH